MRAKTVIELLTLSTNLYMISKDEELMGRLREMADKGKEKLNSFMDDEESEEGGAEVFIDKLLAKAHHMREEVERQMEAVAVKVYEKMHIAHTDQIVALEEEISDLRKKLALAEAKIDSIGKDTPK